MGWNFYNASGELQINDGGVQAASAVFTGKVDLGSNLLVGNAGSTGIAISANGEVTMAAQPCVLRTLVSAVNDVAGDGSPPYTMVFDTEVFDVNGDDNGTTFTAPVTGKYLATGHWSLGDLTSSSAIIDLNIVSSNRQLEAWYNGSNIIDSRLHPSGACIMDMDAADTLVVKMRVTGEGANVVNFGTASHFQISLLV